MIALTLLNVILAVAAIFIPILGGYLTILPGFLTLFLPGRYHLWALVISGLNMTNILFMSPLLRANAAISMQNHDSKWAVLYVGIAMFHGIVAIFVRFKYLRLRKKEERVSKKIAKKRPRKAIGPEEIPPGFSFDGSDPKLATPKSMPLEPELSPPVDIHPKIKT